MKKTITLLTASLAIASSSFAQTDTGHSFKSVRGHEVLPQEKEWALGISASGFLGYIGNLMNGSSSNPGFGFNSANTPTPFALGTLNVGGVALSGKYMKTATLAYRVRFMANVGSNTYRNNVLKSLTTPDPLKPVYVEDNMTMSARFVLLGAGFEKRRGNGRLQGFYGAEAIVGTSGSKTTYKYGNSFSTDFPAPVATYDFNSGADSVQSFRKNESTSGTSFLFGARGFGGVEYFFAPKISLGGEIGYTLGFSTNGKASEVGEFWDPVGSKKNTIKTTNYDNSGLRSIGAGLDNINAGINIHFYF